MMTMTNMVQVTSVVDPIKGSDWCVQGYNDAMCDLAPCGGLVPRRGPINYKGTPLKGKALDEYNEGYVQGFAAFQQAAAAAFGIDVPDAY